MATLKSTVLAEGKRDRVVTDCIHLLDDQVRSKRGFSGAAIKTAYKVVGAIRPGFVRAVVDGLLDDWVDKLEPHYAAWKEQGTPPTFGGYVAKIPHDVADNLLEVTDERAQRTDNKTVKKLYTKLRPNAKEHVAAAVPALGATIDKHL